jgi:head-tail adaptor
MNPLVEAGKRDRVVTILRPTFTTNTQNEQVEGEPDTKVRLASVKPAPGSERFQSAETAAQAPMRFVFAYEPDLVRVTDSIEHDDGRIYAVASVTEIGRREGWEVLATARGEPSE